MKALDTNVLVRVVTRDDAGQLPAALAAMRADQLWLTKTVMLEFEWVLRLCYDLNREVISETLRKILGLRNLEVEDREAVIQAQRWYDQGMDFADALHLASSSEAEAFATFDRSLAKVAKDLGGGPKIELLSPGRQPR